MEVESRFDDFRSFDVIIDHIVLCSISRDTSIVKKSDVTIEPKEIIVFSFWKQSWY